MSTWALDHRPGGTSPTGPTPPGASAPRLPARKAEENTVTWLRSLGLHTVDHPDTPTWSQTGARVLPDVGLRLGTGGPVFDLPDGPIDVIGEIKVQAAAGTAIDKLMESIDRYAHLSDVHGIPAVIFYDLNADNIGQEVIDRYARIADMNLVGFIEIGSVTAGQLRALVADLVRRRRTSTDPEHVADIVANFSPQVLAAAVRYAARRGPALVPTQPGPSLW